MADKKIPLTKKQEQVFALIKNNPGCIIHRHMTMNGTVCYRIRATGANPVANVATGIIDRLAEKKYIIKNSEGHYVEAVN